MYKMNLEHTFNKENYFSGYYDRNPLYDKKLLVHKFSKEQLHSRSGDIEIGYIDIEEKKYRKITSSKAWNWQMGSNASWYDDKSIIFNNIIDGKIKTVIIDINTFKQEEFDFHFYNLFENLIISINYNNISHYRKSYGYLEYNKIDIDPEINLFNMNLKEILKIKKKDFLNKNYLKKRVIFEHPSLSKKYLSFITRIMDSNKQENFLIIYELSIKKFHKLQLSNISHVSLYKNFLTYYGSKYEKKKIMTVIYSKIKNISIVKLLKKIVGLKLENTSFHRYLTSEGLYLYDISKKKFKIIDENLNYDGHPNFYDENTILFDTYPNNQGMGSIIKYDLKKNLKELIHKLEHNTKYINKTNRADFHIKINEKKIIVDRFLDKRFIEIYNF